MQPEPTAFDAIVVGSGISGGWAAKELTEKGLKVLLLERGHMVEHIKDYTNATKGPWEYPHRGGRTQRMVADYPVLKRDYPLNEKNLDFWANDKDSPYTEVKRFDWYRGYQLGGRSLMWGRQSYRWSDFDFEANAKDGIAVDWPIRYKDIAPWYSYVEKFAGIQGTRENLPQLPDGEFLPGFDLNCGERAVKAKLEKHYAGKRHLIIGRTANITKPMEGRGACQTRDACWLGCIYGAYFSTQSSTLPAARKTGTLVDVSSMAAIAPTPGMAFYNAAKGGLAAASESLRAELKQHGLHVVTVYPGPVKTDMESAGRAAYEEMSKLAQLLTPVGEADVLARLIADAVEHKEDRVIYPAINALGRHFPAMTRMVLDNFTPKPRK